MNSLEGGLLFVLVGSEQSPEGLGAGQAFARVVHPLVDLPQHTVVLGTHHVSGHMELPQPLCRRVDLVNVLHMGGVFTNPAEQPG